MMLYAQEDCTNAMDDDGDGLIDLNDSVDCPCGRVLEVDDGIGSYIPNPSFELYDSLPTFISQLDYCTGWSQATAATTDYYVDPAYPLPGTPFPLPDGNAYTGFIVYHHINEPGGPPYVEYIGANLLQPLLAGEVYVLRAYIAGGGLSETAPDFTFGPPWFGPVDITVFGHPDPSALPAGMLGCPTPEGWVEIGRTAYQATPHWSVITIVLEPLADMVAIMVGGPCLPPMDHVVDSVFDPYYLMDDLVLNTREQFTGVITPTGGLCDHDLSLTAHAPPNTVSYQWYLNGVTLLGATDSILAVSVSMGAGTYTCVAFGTENACLAMDHLVAPEPLEVALSVVPRTGCQPLEVEFRCSTSLQSMIWNFDDGTTATGDTVLHTYFDPGTYDGLTVDYTSLSGCAYHMPVYTTITVHPKPEIGINAEPLGPYTGGDEVQLHGIGGPAEHWSWTFGNVPPYLLLNEESTAFTLPTAAGGYEVGLYARNGFDCMDTAYIRFEVPECNANTVFVPSAFSPNANGNNDQQCVYGDCITSMMFRIFDRWGNKVYESTDPKECWDGQHNGQPLEAGAFVYHLRATLVTQEVVEKQGSITLLR